MRKRISTVLSPSPLPEGAQSRISAPSSLRNALLLHISGERFYVAAEAHHFSALRRIPGARHYVGDTINYVSDAMHYVAYIIHNVADIMSFSFFLPGYVPHLLHWPADIVHFKKNIMHYVRDIMHWVSARVHYDADIIGNGSFHPAITF